MSHRRSLVVSLALAFAVSCASTPAADDEPLPKLLDKPVPDSIGKTLADLDDLIARWSTLTMTANSPAEQREARAIDALLFDVASKRRTELEHELQVGPPVNRMRAAAALGFSRAVEAQSPLLGALEDPNPDVVHNALFGLAVLGLQDTPLDRICDRLENASDSQTRAQAAWAVRSIVAAGGSGSTVQLAARRGLVDNEPLVRTQCALVLGILGDTESIRAIGDLMYDKAPIASQAAVEALTEIAKKDPGQKGVIGRRLVEALDKGDSNLQRRAKAGLTQISDVNYGSDMQAWIEWAARLP